MIIRQILPVPEKYRVMIKAEDENGISKYRDLEKEGWTAPLFLLFDDPNKHGEIDSYIAIYSIDPHGRADFNVDFMLQIRDDNDTGKIGGE